MPQLNVMTAGMSVKSMIGLVVMIVGLSAFNTPNVLEEAVADSISAVTAVWHAETPAHS